MYQHGLWFPTETLLRLTSELCCPSAPDAAPDFTNSFLLFLGLRSGVIVTAVRRCSSFLPERLCLPSSEHLGQSLFPVVFSRLSLPVVQLYWCVCGYAPRSVSSWNLPASSRLPGGGPSRHRYRAASPLPRQGFDGLQSSTDIPLPAWCSRVRVVGIPHK